MIYLGLNSATTYTEIAIVKNQKVLAEKSWISKKDEAEKILPEVNKLLKKTRLSFNDLDELFLICGPGSFTGLRVGVTIGNALGFGLDLKMKEASTFDLLQAKLIESQRKETVIVISAGGGRVAVTCGKLAQKQFELDEFKSWLKNQAKIKFALLDLRGSQKSEVKKIMKIFRIKELGTKDYKSFGKAIITLLKKKSTKQKMIKPVYLQKPNITESKKPVFT